MKIFIGIIFLLLLLGTVNAQTAPALSNEASGSVGILFPVERTYSLSPDGPWQVEPISFEYNGEVCPDGDYKYQAIYIRIENHVPIQYEMRVLHEFSRNHTGRFNHGYHPFYDSEIRYSFFDVDNNKPMPGYLVWMSPLHFKRIEHNETSTIYRWRWSNFMNSIGPNEIRIEEVRYRFRYFWDQPGIYTYDSHIELVGSKFK